MQSLPQVSTFPGSSFFITSAGSSMPLETVQMDLQGNPLAFSSVFADRRSSFFDSGLSTWYEHPVFSLIFQYAIVLCEVCCLVLALVIAG